MAVVVGTYTDAAVQAKLQDEIRRWSFRYDLLDKTLAYKRSVNVVSCSISQSSLADKVKRTANLAIPAAEIGGIDLFNDRLRAYALLQMPDGNWKEFACGTFHLTTSGKRVTNRRRMVDPSDAYKGTVSEPYVDTMSITGYDSLIILDEDKVLDRYVVTAGTNYRTAIVTLLTSAGFSISAIDTTASTLPADMEWPPGTPKLVIINNLLSSINYDTLHMNPMGIPTAGTYQAPNVAPIIYAYKVDRTSVIIPGIDTELDLFNIPNVWVAFVSEPDRPILRSVVTNSDPTSPLSTVNRGRQIVEIVEPDRDSPEEEQDIAATQALLDAKVARTASEASQQYETASFSTGLMPFHDHGDVFTLDYGDGIRRFRETEWSMELRAGGSMSHSMRRVVII